MVEPHGLQSFWKGCRCVVCRAAFATYRRSRRMVPVPPVPIARVKKALRPYADLGHDQVANLAKVSVSTVQRVRRGRRGTVQGHVAARLMGISRQPAGGWLMPSTHAMKWIQALMEEGYREDAVFRMLKRRTPIGPQIRFSTHEAIRRLHDALIGTPEDEWNEQ